MPDREKPIFVVPETLDGITSDNAQSGHPAINVGRHKAAGVVYKSSGATSVNLKGHFGSSGTVEPEIDFVALLGTNAQAGTTARFKLGSSTGNAASGAGYDSGAQTIRSPAPVAERPDGLSHWFWEVPSIGPSANTRFWQIDIGGHSGDFQASMLIIGKKVQSSKFYNPDYQFGTQDLGKADVGQWGVVEDSGGKILRTIDFTLGWEDEAQFEASFRPMMERVGQRQPVYCCFDPAATAYRQARTYFGLLRKPLVARGIRKPKTYSQEFSILSLI